MSTERELGEIKARLSALEQDQHEFKKEQGEMRKDVREIRDMFLQAKGGWKFLALMGGAAATMGGMASWVATHLKWTP